MHALSLQGAENSMWEWGERAAVSKGRALMPEKHDKSLRQGNVKIHGHEESGTKQKKRRTILKLGWTALGNRLEGIIKRHEVVFVPVLGHVQLWECK